MIVEHSLLPKDKYDSKAVEKLNRLTEEQIQPLIPSLLMWLQDINWPIALEVLPIIARHQNIAMPHIKSIFYTDDEIWKHWILIYLVPLLTKGNLQVIKEDLVYLSSPDKTADEDVAETVRLSKECIALHFTE